MKKVKFEWDENKNQDNQNNQEKHNVPFEFAQYAFADPNRVIEKSGWEKWVGPRQLTVL